jgi:hypothetical protein
LWPFIEKIEKSDWGTDRFMWRIGSLTIEYCFVSHVISMLIDDFSVRAQPLRDCFPLYKLWKLALGEAGLK